LGWWPIGRTRSAQIDTDILLDRESRFATPFLSRSPRRTRQLEEGLAWARGGVMAVSAPPAGPCAATTTYAYALA
jgi:hypothetical protein